VSGDNPRDKYSGLIPDAIGKDKTVEDVFASYEKTEKLIKDMMDKKESTPVSSQ